jgi:DNA methylase/ParB-like nuclease family protein
MSARTKQLPPRNRRDHETQRNRSTAAVGVADLDRLKVLIRQTALDFCPLERLQLNPANLRIHTPRQIAKIADSIREFGFNNPILVDETGLILAGHGRFAAAAQLGLTEVPVVRLSHLSAPAKRLFTLADNRLAELASWDEERLITELQELCELSLDIDLEITGFDTVDLDRLLAPQPREKGDPADLVPEADLESTPISRVGEVWLLGPHKLICGDALDAATYQMLLGRERAQMVFTDPPFNVPIPGHAVGQGCSKHPNFLMASGEMSPREFTTFLGTALGHFVDWTEDGSIHFVAMDWRHLPEILSAGRLVYAELKNLCVWVKTNAGMGSFYRSQHELFLVFKNGGSPHINSFGLGQRGRYRTNVWTYPGVNSFKPGREGELAMHPTVKPVAMVMDALKDCSRRGGIVLDPFAGSGTTIIAAQRTGRIARAAELDPRYVDVILRRWDTYTGEPSRRASDGCSFAELAAAASPPSKRSVGRR